MSVCFELESRECGWSSVYEKGRAKVHSSWWHQPLFTIKGNIHVFTLRLQGPQRQACICKPGARKMTNCILLLICRFCAVQVYFFSTNNNNLLLMNEIKSSPHTNHAILCKFMHNFPRDDWPRRGYYPQPLWPPTAYLLNNKAAQVIAIKSKPISKSQPVHLIRKHTMLSNQHFPAWGGIMSKTLRLKAPQTCPNNELHYMTNKRINE